MTLKAVKTPEVALPLRTSLVGCRRCTVVRILPHVAALFSLQLVLAAVTDGFDPLRGSHSRRSSACGFVNHAIAGDGSV